jgi:hypothetical protein
MSAELNLIGFTGAPGLTGGSVGLAEREQRIRRLTDRPPRFVFRHWSRERDGAFSTGPREGETG